MIKPVALNIISTVKRPKMEIGCIYSVTNNKMPDRFLVLSIVYNNGFKYGGIYESNPSKMTAVPCEEIELHLSQRYRREHAHVYNSPMFNLREAKGYRWVGNYKSKDECRRIGKRLATSPNISEIRITEGYNRHGSLDGSYGLWIKYSKQLDELFKDHIFIERKEQENESNDIFCEVIKTTVEEPTGQVVFIMDDCVK